MRTLATALALALVVAPATAETKIVASLDNVTGLPFQAGVKASMMQAAKKDTSLSVTVGEIGQDPAQHLQNVEAAIAAKANAMIVNISDPTTARKVAALAATAGMPLVFLNRRPSLDRMDGKVSIVSSNDLVAGRLQMRVLADRLGGKGAIAILRGPDADTAAKERHFGMQEVLANYPGLKVATEANANWSRDEARQIVTGWLRDGHRLDAIAVANDEMALGAVAALRTAGLAGKVLVGGVDGGKEAVNAVKAGDMVCTILQNGAAQGAQAVSNAATLGRGNYAQQYDWVPYELILAENADTYAQR